MQTKGFSFMVTPWTCPNTTQRENGALLKLQRDESTGKWSKTCLKCGKVYLLTEKAKQLTLLSDAFKDNNKTSKEIDEYIEEKLKKALNS